MVLSASDTTVQGCVLSRTFLAQVARRPQDAALRKADKVSKVRGFFWRTVVYKPEWRGKTVAMMDSRDSVSRGPCASFAIQSFVQPPVLSTCPLHTNSGCGKEANINWSMVICQGSTRSELP